MRSKDSILIAGLGAIGSILYSRLDRARVKIVCLTSKRGTEDIRKNGLEVKLIFDETPKLHKIEVYEFLPDDYKFDSCIVATKAYNNQVLADYLVDYMNDNASILLFQNGMDVEIPFTEKSKDWQITRVVSSVGSYRDHKQVMETAVGETKIGGVNHSNSAELEKWSALLNKIGLESTIPDDFSSNLWLKTIVNSVINPIGAITKLKNGAIISEKQLLGVVERTIDEILEIVKDEVSISRDMAYETVLKIGQITASNKCSMLQDLENGVETEIEYLNGKFIEMAQSKGIDAPINTKLATIVKKLSEKSEPEELAILEFRSLL